MKPKSANVGRKCQYAVWYMSVLVWAYTHTGEHCMSRSTETLYRPPPIKGAAGHILQLLEACTVNGVCLISLDAIAELTGYCRNTIQQSIRQLHTYQMIEVSKVYGDRRNCYRVKEYDVSQTPA